MGVSCCSGNEKDKRGEQNLTNMQNEVQHVIDHQMGNGSVYSGQMKRVFFDEGEFATNVMLPHGNGLQMWEDGSKYDGEWHEGKAEGRGVFTYSNGDIYVG